MTDDALLAALTGLFLLGGAVLSLLAYSLGYNARIRDEKEARRVDEIWREDGMVEESEPWEMGDSWWRGDS